MGRVWTMLACLVALTGAATANEPPEGPELSKKERELAEKRARTDRRAVTPPKVATAEPALTLHNVWTNESLPIVASLAPEKDRFDALVRCHYTNQATSMDPRLVDVVTRAAKRFGKRYVEIVSGFRAPKYQLFLRKKGREVARDSEHPRGHAVDFRVPGVPTRQLLAYVRSLKIGGVGFYPHSAFVHTDVGRVRFWRGN
jgi:uncharacterized protein YcbK (DUF882 family)